MGSAARGKRATHGKVEREIRVLVAVRHHLRLVGTHPYAPRAMNFSQTKLDDNGPKRVMDFSVGINDNDRAPDQPGQTEASFPTRTCMTRKSATAATIKRASSQPPVSETEQQRFERILSRAHFKPLKTIFDNLGIAVPVMQGAIITTNSYQMFLGKLGYRVEVVKQLREQDCYPRLGPKGGVRAVVPLHDTTTYSTMITLVNFDTSLTTTQKSVDYYDEQLSEFKTQLMNRSGDAG
jgi:hypothetical protein